MKKRLFIFTILCCALMLLCSCGEAEKTKTAVSVIISADYELVNMPIELNVKNPVAADAIIKACQSQKIAYTLKNGLFDGFGGIKSTEKDGWILYINNSLSPLGAKEMNVSAGDVIEFRYVNYDAVFDL